MIQLLKPLEYWDDLPTTGRFGDLRDPGPNQWIHHGTDKAANTDTVIYAMHDGQVTHWEDKNADGSWRGYGKNLELWNRDLDLYTIYAHAPDNYGGYMTDNHEWVKAGTPIMRVDNTGWSTGPHLHTGARRISTMEWFDIEPFLVDVVGDESFTLDELKQRMEWAFQLQHEAVHDKMNYSDLPAAVQKDFRRAEVGVQEARGVITSAEADALRSTEGL